MSDHILIPKNFNTMPKNVLSRIVFDMQQHLDSTEGDASGHLQSGWGQQNFTPQKSQHNPDLGLQ